MNRVRVGRFVEVGEMGLGGDGRLVRDLETGLVWLKAPHWLKHPGNGCPVGWEEARGLCDDIKWLCGVSGWRLPTVKELVGLVDYGQSIPALPPGHPFIGIHPSFYWTSQKVLLEGEFEDEEWWCVSFKQGWVSCAAKDSKAWVWPVSGGEGGTGGVGQLSAWEEVERIRWKGEEGPPKDKVREVCGGCHYYMLHPGLRRGSCRRHPPMLGTGDGRFPVVFDGMWCGEFKARAEGGE